MRFSRYIAVSFQIPNGDGEIRTLDPLLARQVLSQLSYTPIRMRVYPVKAIPILFSFPFRLFPLPRSSSGSGLKWTRTTDLTLIRRAL